MEDDLVKKTYYCKAAQLGPICCSSCHEDADLRAGYDLCDFEAPDGREWLVCCAVMICLENEETYQEVSQRLDNLEKEF